MYKKVLILLVCLLTSASSWAGTRYYYMENPDPVHFQIVWKGANPNCHEMGPNGYETYGWIIHGKSSPEYIAIVQKDAPEFGAFRLCNGCRFQHHLGYFA